MSTIDRPRGRPKKDRSAEDKKVRDRLTEQIDGDYERMILTKNWRTKN